MNPSLESHAPDSRLMAAIRDGDGWLYPESNAMAECWETDARPSSSSLAIRQRVARGAALLGAAARLLTRR